MTADKDFTRVVRTRAARTGESYAAARRRLLADSTAPDAAPDKDQPMTITRAVPDIRSDDIEASRAFYAGLLGFDVSMESGKFLLFTSPSDSNVQVSLNGDFDSLPAGSSSTSAPPIGSPRSTRPPSTTASGSSNRSRTSRGGSAASPCSTRAGHG